MFMIDAFALVALVFFSVRNDVLREGAKQVGIFAYRDPEEPQEPGGPRKARR